MFTSNADLARADWPLLQNGAVNLFRRADILLETCQALERLGYDIATVKCRDGVFYRELSAVLNWAEQFGYARWNGNLDALVDGLRGYPFGPSGRSALVLDGFHKLVAKQPEDCHAILDILERSARDHLLWGNALIVLVQTDDPHYLCPAIGARSAHWNLREWSSADRGI